VFVQTHLCRLARIPEGIDSYFKKRILASTENIIPTVSEIEITVTYFAV